MKLFSLLFLSLLLGKGCDNETKQDIESAVVVYEANTRGFYQQIRIENKTVTVSKERYGKDNPQAIAITDTDWKMLIGLFQEMNLEEMKDLKSPTEKRFYDGAAIANVKITYKGKTYQSSSFDHGYPPVEIKDFINKINSFANQKDDN